MKRLLTRRAAAMLALCALALGGAAQSALATAAGPADPLQIGDDTALTREWNALVSGDLAGLPEDDATRVAGIRSVATASDITIPGEGGVNLDGALLAPKTDTPYPLVVMPGGLVDKQGWTMYTKIMQALVGKGYAVVAYTERGLAESEGELQIAGPLDWADGKEVINWALSNPDLDVDSDAIGCMGVSYGSGICQLLALYDERVAAVVGLSAWADLGRSLYENNTRHVAAADALVGSANWDRFSAEAKAAVTNLRENTDIPGVLAFAARRSPATYLSDLNRLKVPTMLTTHWHETIFGTNQLVDHFNNLTGPKRLEAYVGDHSASEGVKMMLDPDGGVLARAYDWLDHHLRDIDNGIDQAQLRTERMWWKTAKTHDDWESFTVEPRRYWLSPPAAGGQDGTLGETAGSPWKRSITVGDSGVKAADQIVFTGIAERLGLPKRYDLATVDRAHASVHRTTPLAQTQRISGAAKLKTTVTSAAPGFTIVAYLLDHDPSTGKAFIISHEAITKPDAAAATPTEIDFRLQATDYRLAAGRELVLVLSTHDPLYAGEAPDGTAVEIAGAPEAYLDIPIA